MFKNTIDKNNKDINNIFSRKMDNRIKKTNEKTNENNKKVNKNNEPKLTKEDLTTDIVVDYVIEKIDENEKKGLTFDDGELIYYEDKFFDNKKITKIKIGSIIQKLMKEFEIKIKTSFIKEVIEILKIEVYPPKKSFEQVKKIIENNTNKSLTRISNSNEGIIFGTFDEIIGYDDIKIEVLEDVTSWIKYPEEYIKRKAKRNIGSIFYGISGTGKTVTALALNKELLKKGFDIEYMYIKTQQLSSGQISESANKISDFFSELRKNKKPTILLMDEIDFLCKTRNEQAFSTERTTEFLKQLGGSYDNNNFYIIGTTNNPDNIDHSLLENRRFTRQYLFTVPNLFERREFAKRFIIDKNLNIETKTSEEELIEIIAKNTEYFTGAGFEQILVDCIKLIIKKKENKDKEIITILELINIINKNAPRKTIKFEINKLNAWKSKKN